MKKNLDRSNITKRLIALLTIAVFVFVMAFYPVNIVSAADTDEAGSVESTEAVQNQDMEVDKEDAAAEAVDDSEDVDENEGTDGNEDVSNAHEDDWGYLDIPEIREMLTVKESEEPAYLKKEERRLEKTLEDVYDPREMPYYKDRVAMLDQGFTHTCWAHAIATTAQISYLKELYSKSSLGDKNYQLAALDFAYNFYNRVPYEKYGYTAEDKNIPIGDTDWGDIGGNNVMSSLALFGWMGLHSIENAGYEDSNAYNNILVLQNSRFYDDIKKHARVGEKDYDFSVLNQTIVKQAIKDYGAVSVSMNMKNAYSNDEADTGTWRGKRFNSYNCDYSFEYKNDKSKVGSVNHGVTLIGWDNAFPKEYFTKQPQNDGAWIMQNSKGTDNGPGQGFWYVSYEDLSLNGALSLDMQPADTYDANYQYDGNAMPASFDRKIGTQAANVFTVPEEEAGHSVEAVGFVTYNQYLTKFKVSIYKGVSTEPTSGTLAAAIDVQTDYPGCYTFNLSENGASPVNVAAGEKFSVIVEATETADDNGRMSLGYERASEDDDPFQLTFTSAGNGNTSFYKYPKTDAWNDVAGSNSTGSFRIKAFATKLDTEQFQVTLPASNYNYTGKIIKPEPTVKYKGQKLIKGTDYTLSYGANKYPGKGTVTITGKGFYKVTVTKTFNIAGVNKFRQSAAAKKSVTLRWDKSPNVKGYKIYRLKKGKFKLIKTIKKNSKVKFTDKKLKAGTKYQYKIRTYRKIGKKVYYGPLSDALVVKTKAR